MAQGGMGGQPPGGQPIGGLGAYGAPLPGQFARNAAMPMPGGFGGPSMTNMDMANPASRGAWGAPMPGGLFGRIAQQPMPGGFGGMDPAKLAAMAGGPAAGAGPSMNQNLWRLPGGMAAPAAPAMRANDPMPRPGGMMAPMPMPTGPAARSGEVRVGGGWQPMPPPATPPGLLGGMPGTPQQRPMPMPQPPPAPSVADRQLAMRQQLSGRAPPAPSRPVPQPAMSTADRQLAMRRQLSGRD